MRISQSIHRFLDRLGPYQSLLILAIPLAIVEPLKLVALFVVGGGHFIAGVLVMICAYAGSLFITERLFVVLKPKLLTLPWFALAWPNSYQEFIPKIHTKKVSSVRFSEGISCVL
jgi:hypothetical protein